MRPFLLALLFLPAVATSAAAQVAGLVDQSSFFHAIATGAGARAWAMGGTQIAVTGEADAVSWNPAGLGRLARPVLSLSLSADRVNGTVPIVVYQNPSVQETGFVDVGTITPTRSRASGYGLDFAALAIPF